MKVDCNSATFCMESITIPPGALLADAVRAAGWLHVREPGGKSKNFCPKHKQR